MLPLLEEVRAAVAVHVAALPVPYRTHATEPSMQSLRDPLADGPDHRAFPTGLDPFTCTRGEIARFTADALALGIHYLGRLLRRRAPPRPGDGRGDRAQPGGEPLLGRHVQARVPRHGRRASSPSTRPTCSGSDGAVDATPMMRG